MPAGFVVRLVFDLVAMSGLLLTSVMISQTVFGVLDLHGGATARQMHRLAAYWALAIASVHLGLHWHMVMRATRAVLGLRRAGPWRATGLRLVATILVVQGVQSSFDMALGSKLVLHPVPEMWDFQESVSGFFLHHASIVAVYAVLGHCGSVWLRGRRTGPGGASP